MKTKELEALKTRLKSGEYDGNDIMQAWIAIERLIGLLGSEWISVKDRLPERDENVRYSQVPCIVIHSGDIRILVFNHEHKCWDTEDFDDYYCDIKDVSCWMPLPERPKEQQEPS